GLLRWRGPAMCTRLARRDPQETAMLRNNHICAYPFGIVAALLVASQALADNDPLPSWNDTGPKAAIIDFVKKVTANESPDFVPLVDRVAVLDNEGTLTIER